VRLLLFYFPAEFARFRARTGPISTLFLRVLLCVCACVCVCVCECVCKRACMCVVRACVECVWGLCMSVRERGGGGRGAETLNPKP